MGNQHANLLDESWKYGYGADAIHSVLRQQLVFRHSSYDDLSDEEIRQITKHVLGLRKEGTP